MRDSAKLRLEQITRLLDNSAPHSSANPAERLRGFITAAEDYDPLIVRMAVNNFLKGIVEPRHNPAFPIHAPMLASECRRLLAAQLTRESRTAGAIQQLRLREEVFHLDPPELRRMTVERDLARAAVLNPDKQPERIAESAARDARFLENHDRLFAASLGADTMARRLRLDKRPAERD